MAGMTRLPGNPPADAMLINNDSWQIPQNPRHSVPQRARCKSFALLVNSRSVNNAQSGWRRGSCYITSAGIGSCGPYDDMV